MAKNRKKTKKKSSKHERINDILLGPLERPALLWLAAHMPQWVTPDMLTLIGFLASLMIGASYWLTNFNKNYLWLANLGFILNWFGDSLDGNLARYRKIERPRYGFFIDHVVDSISEVAIFLGLAYSPYVDFTLGTLALIAYLCMSILVYITTFVRGVFKISYGKLGPTEVRLIAIIANIVIFFIDNPQIKLPFNRTMTLYNLIVACVTILLFGFFFATAIKEGKRLDRKDRKKWLKKVRKAKESAGQG